MDLSKLQRYSTSFNGEMDEDTYGVWCEFADVQALAAGADAGRPTDSPTPDPVTPDAERIARIRGIPRTGINYGPRTGVVSVDAADRDWLCNAAERTGAAERDAWNAVERAVAAELELSTKTCPRCEVDSYWFKATKIAETRADRLAAEVAGLRATTLEEAYQVACDVSSELWAAGESYHAVGAQAVANRLSDRIASGPARSTTTGE